MSLIKVKVKWSQFISKSTETFSFASPVEVIRAVKVFAGDLYGSNLWQLAGAQAEQVYHAWDTCIKLAWQVPRGTHTYFVERMLGCGISHVRTDILARYVNFLKSLRESPSVKVSILANIVARDVRTTTGRNLHHIRDLTDLDSWSYSSSKINVVLGDKLKQMPTQDMWRLQYPGKLLEERGGLHFKLEDTAEFTNLIDSICVN